MFAQGLPTRTAALCFRSAVFGIGRPVGVIAKNDMKNRYLGVYARSPIQEFYKKREHNKGIKKSLM